MYLSIKSFSQLLYYSSCMQQYAVVNMHNPKNVYSLISRVFAVILSAYSIKFSILLCYKKMVMLLQ